MNKSKQHAFTRKLTQWHAEQNHRDLPWKGISDPYRIWLSEILLQQTRAEQALPYYLRFIEQYPNIQDLAQAPDDEVYNLWQGLGYYSRCKNLLKTARQVCSEFSGTFPNKYNDILQLSGVGPYTAAAIASFAFQLPHAVVDGNVYRVLSRYFGVATPIDSTAGKKEFATLAQSLLDKQNPATYNQAIMDFGATVCTPRNVQCQNCCLQNNCSTFGTDLIHLLPIKAKKNKVKKRYFIFVKLLWKEKVYMEQRKGKDIWENLYQPFTIEIKEPLSQEKQVSAIQKQLDKVAYWQNIEYINSSKQKLSHQLIHGYWYEVKITKLKEGKLPENHFYTKEKLNLLAMPKTILSYM